MAKWVVIGGFGFIGSRLVKRLIREEEEVVVIDDADFTPISPVVPNYREKRYEFDYRTNFYPANSVKGRISAAKIVQKSINSELDISQYNADYIVYASGPSVPVTVHSKPKASRDQMMGGLHNVLDRLMGDRKTKNIVYLSSSMVYGDFQYTPIKEEHPTHPLELYGTYKLTCENILFNYWYRHHIPYTILRLSGVYGPGDGNERVIERLMNNALKGKTLEVRDSMVDFTYVDDVVDGIIRAALKAQSNTFNLSSGRGTKISEIAEHISDKLVFGTEINHIAEEDWRPVRGALNIEKAWKHFGYKPKYTLEKGLNTYFEYLKRRQDLIYDKV